MKLYELWIKANVRTRIYDIVNGAIVRAENAKMARELLAGETGDDGYLWLDPKKTSCTCLKENGKPEVIIRDFNAG